MNNHFGEFYLPWENEFGGLFNRPCSSKNKKQRKEEIKNLEIDIRTNHNMLIILYEERNQLELSEREENDRRIMILGVLNKTIEMTKQLQNKLGEYMKCLEFSNPKESKINELDKKINENSNYGNELILQYNTLIDEIPLTFEQQLEELYQSFLKGELSIDEWHRKRDSLKMDEYLENPDIPIELLPKGYDNLEGIDCEQFSKDGKKQGIYSAKDIRELCIMEQRIREQNSVGF